MAVLETPELLLRVGRMARNSPADRLTGLLVPVSRIAVIHHFSPAPGLGRAARGGPTRA